MCGVLLLQAMFLFLMYYIHKSTDKNLPQICLLKNSNYIAAGMVFQMEISYFIICPNTYLILTALYNFRGYFTDLSYFSLKSPKWTKKKLYLNKIYYGKHIFCLGLLFSTTGIMIDRNWEKKNVILP